MNEKKRTKYTLYSKNYYVRKKRNLELLISSYVKKIFLDQLDNFIKYMV